VKPTLKKISKTEGQFAKLKKKEGLTSEKVDFRNNLKNLKSVEKKQFSLSTEVVFFIMLCIQSFLPLLFRGRRK
jgi:hypothetical protein